MKMHFSEVLAPRWGCQKAASLSARPRKAPCVFDCSNMLQVGRRCMIIAPGNYTALSMTHNPLWNKTYWEGKPVCGASKWLERPLKENCGLEVQLWVKDFGLTQQQVLFPIFQFSIFQGDLFFDIIKLLMIEKCFSIICLIKVMNVPPFSSFVI